MLDYELMFRLDGTLTDELVDAVYDSGLDCLISEDHGGVPEIIVTASGPDVVAAGVMAMSVLARHGACAVELRPDLVDRIAIADRAEVTRAAVGHWVRGDRGDKKFPPTFSDVAGGVWLWGDVMSWLAANGHPVDGPTPPDRQEHIRLSAHVLGLRSQSTQQQVEVPVMYRSESLGVASWENVKAAVYVTGSASTAVWADG